MDLGLVQHGIFTKSEISVKTKSFFMAVHIDRLPTTYDRAASASPKEEII